MKKWRFTFSWGIFATLLSGFLFFYPSPYRSLLHSWNWPLWDKFQKSYVGKPSSNIVIIKWGPGTNEWFMQHGGSPKLEYHIIGKVCLWLKKAGAETTALDIFFTAKTSYDAKLTHLFKKCGNIVLATVVGPIIYRGKIVSIQYSVDNRHFAKVCKIGYANFQPDSDGVVRSILIYPNFYLAPFGFEAARHYLSRPPETLLKKQLHLRFSRNLTALFPSYSFREVMKHQVSPQFFKNKLVFIGFTNPSAHDVHLTPVGRVPGVFIQALAAENFLNKNFIHLASWKGQLLLLLFLNLTLTVMLLEEKKGRGFLTSLLVLIIGYYLYFGAEYLEHSKGIFVNVAFFWSGLIISYFPVFIYKHLQTEKESTWIKGAFTHYVGPEVMKELTQKRDLLSPSGTKKELTILFLDIRGFTTLSESSNPEALVTQLKEFFEIMGTVIMIHKGYINKFLGDGFLAVFGLTETERHAEQALQAAEEMVKILEDQNKIWRGSGKPEFSIGIGIHTGAVLWGDVGSRQHSEYTVIGDTVNTASRIQDVTKRFPHYPILLSSHAFQKLEAALQSQCQSLGEVTLRGRKTPIQLYGVSENSREQREP